MQKICSLMTLQHHHSAVCQDNWQIFIFLLSGVCKCFIHHELTKTNIMSTELTTPDLRAPMSETLSLQIAPLGWCWSSHVSSPDHCLKTFTNVAFSSIQHVACYTHLLCVYYSCAFQFYTKFTLISWMLFDWVNELKDVTVDLINNRLIHFLV